MAKHDFGGGVPNLCIRCQGQAKKRTLATDCRGEPLTDEQRKGLEAETLDYFNGRWWLAEPSVYAEGGTTAATDLPRTVEDALALPCHECKTKVDITFRAPDTTGHRGKWLAVCPELGGKKKCTNDHQVWGDDKASVIHMWNKRQYNASNAPSKAFVSEPTPPNPQGGKSNSGSLEARLSDLESTVDDILRGRVFRRR